MAEWGGALIGETAIKENEREWEKKNADCILEQGTSQEKLFPNPLTGKNGKSFNSTSFFNKQWSTESEVSEVCNITREHTW